MTHREASWSLEAIVQGSPVVTEAADFQVNADFPAETAGYSVATSLPVYQEGDALPECDVSMLLDGNCPAYYTIQLRFSATEPSLSPMDVCAKSGISFSYEHASYLSWPTANITVLQQPTCANGMNLILDVKEYFMCIFDPDNCGNTLGAIYTIHASWTEISSAPPPEAGTVTHEPVIYSYDPNECSSPN